jgi:hypothetical protein
MLTKQFDDVLPTFGYAEEIRQTAMSKLRFVITALAALFAGYLDGVISRPAPLVATLSVLPALPAVIGLSVCWHPGLERNNSISIPPGCEAQ